MNRDFVDLSGETLCGQYYLRQLAGSGGTADVYQAWDKQRSTRMAVKILRRDLAQSKLIYEQFMREDLILRKLEHPNIVRRYEFKKDEQFEVCFIVMDWVDGTDLHRAIADLKRPFTAEEVGRVLHPVGSALHFAHQSNVFHCDIKPANILLHTDRRVLLTDFGVARLAGGANLAWGTPPYMAPEQFTGDAVNARTDVYSLGVTLYEMLSGGKVPFRGESPNSQGSTLRERIAWEHQFAPLPAIRAANPNVSEALEAVVRTAMSKEPQQRYGSVQEFTEAFDRAVLGDGNKGYEQPAPTTLFPGLSLWAAPSNPRRETPPPPAPPKAPKKESPRPAPPPKPQPKPQPQVKGPYLVARAGWLAGQRVDIGSGLTIGRSRECNFHLSDPSVSRTHAALIVGNRAIYIRDLNSTGGTFVNGVRIYADVALKPGDVIQIGNLDVFEFRLK